jgi:hypothetical protein
MYRDERWTSSAAISAAISAMSVYIDVQHASVMFALVVARYSDIILVDNPGFPIDMVDRRALEEREKIRKGGVRAWHGCIVNAI